MKISEVCYPPVVSHINSELGVITREKEKMECLVASDSF